MADSSAQPVPDPIGPALSPPALTPSSLSPSKGPWARRRPGLRQAQPTWVSPWAGPTQFPEPVEGSL